VIEGYAPVQVQGKNNGVGAVAGGLGGALIGSKIAGRGNHTLGGAIGAVGGGLLGNAIESHERTSTAYDVRVRMEDGTVRTVRQAAMPTVGQHVTVEGNTMKAVPAQG
jgi:outer membrane lipoprotein SlyB